MGRVIHLGGPSVGSMWDLIDGGEPNPLPTYYNIPYYDYVNDVWKIYQTRLVMSCILSADQAVSSLSSPDYGGTLTWNKVYNLGDLELTDGTSDITFNTPGYYTVSIDLATDNATASIHRMKLKKYSDSAWNDISYSFRENNINTQAGHSVTMSQFLIRMDVGTKLQVRSYITAVGIGKLWLQQYSGMLIKFVGFD